MKTVLIVVLGMLVMGGGLAAWKVRGAMAGEMQTPTQATDGVLWDLETATLEGEPVSLGEWKGDVVLVVNTASKCGLTPQYEGLEKLHAELKDQGFAVLGFPCNQFMGQEPGSAEQIREFCSLTYGVTFPMFAKLDVKGDDRSPIYDFLLAGGLEEPTWNFTKYLVGRDGKVIARFSPKTTPEDEDLRKAIQAALKG